MTLFVKMESHSCSNYENSLSPLPVASRRLPERDEKIKHRLSQRTILLLFAALCSVVFAEELLESVVIFKAGAGRKVKWFSQRSDEVGKGLFLQGIRTGHTGQERQQQQFLRVPQQLDIGEADKSAPFSSEETPVLAVEELKHDWSFRGAFPWGLNASLEQLVNNSYAPWISKGGVSLADIQATKEQPNWFEIDEEGVVHGGSGRAMDYISRALQRFPKLRPQVKVTFALGAGDWPEYPIREYSTHRVSDSTRAAGDKSIALPLVLGSINNKQFLEILLPFAGRDAFGASFEAVRETLLDLGEKNAWSDKKPVAMWRGSLGCSVGCGSRGDLYYPENHVHTCIDDHKGYDANAHGRCWGCEVSTGAWRFHPRVRLVNISLSNPSCVDARLTTLNEHAAFVNGEVGEELARSWMGEAISEDDLAGYKYVVNVQNNGFADRFWRLLALGHVIFQEEHTFHEFFYDMLLPWVHFIPVKSDFSDLCQKIEWAKAHDEQARRISENARSFIKNTFTLENIDLYVASIVHRAGELTGLSGGVVETLGETRSDVFHETAVRGVVRDAEAMTIEDLAGTVADPGAHHEYTVLYEKLVENQNPPVCAEACFYTMSFQHSAGFGSQVNMMAAALGMAMNDKCVLIESNADEVGITSAWSRRGVSSSKGIMPLTHCTMSEALNVTELNRDDVGSKYIRYTPVIHGVEVSISLWQHGAKAYLLRPTSAFQTVIDAVQRDIEWHGNECSDAVVGFHVRHGDKAKEASLLPFEDYLDELGRWETDVGVESYHQQRHKCILLVTDDKDLTSRMSDNPRATAGGASYRLIGTWLNSMNSALASFEMGQILLDLHLLSRARTLMFTFSSNFGQLAMQMNPAHLRQGMIPGKTPSILPLDFYHHAFQHGFFLMSPALSGENHHRFWAIVPILKAEINEKLRCYPEHGCHLNEKLATSPVSEERWPRVVACEIPSCSCCNLPSGDDNNANDLSNRHLSLMRGPWTSFGPNLSEAFPKEWDQFAKDCSIV